MNNAVNFFKSLLQAGVAVIVSVIFILISKFILRGYFYDTAYPVNMDYGEWADLFVRYVASICCNHYFKHFICCFFFIC